MSEDRAEIIDLGDVVIVVVADGAGGMRGGAVASDALVLAAKAAARDAAFDPFEPGAWARVLLDVDRALSTRMAGETTAVIVALGPRGLLGVSAGDSEAWVVDDAGVDDGIDELTTSQSKWRLGSGRATPVAFARPALDGTLLVATDGLFKLAGRAQLAALVRARTTELAPDLAPDLDLDLDQGLAHRALALIAHVRLPSGRLADDVAVVLVESA